jgi:hypothetical protein
MTLFDAIERHDEGPARYSEPEFVYLNRTARIEVGVIRRELEQWYSRYPTPEQAELRARFRSVIDAQYRSAFFELFLHEILLRFGCQITIHPSVARRTRTPDFLVASPSGEQFYIEATLATNQSSEEVSAQARINAVYDILNKVVNSSNFFLAVSIEGAPATPPSTKRMASFLNARLAELDPDQIFKLYQSEGYDALPSWLFEHAGWKIRFTPIPKAAEARKKTGMRTLGSFSTDFRWADNWTALRDAITGKAGRYGDLDLPYVVAVNFLDYPDETDIMQGLFGQEQFTVFFHEIGGGESTELPEPRFTRAANGAWTSRDGPQYTRVSAVLVASRLSPWTITKAPLRLYHNPWAQRKYESVLTQLPQSIPDAEQMRYVDGLSNALIFGLPETWPKLE